MLAHLYGAWSQLTNLPIAVPFIAMTIMEKGELRSPMATTETGACPSPSLTISSALLNMTWTAASNGAERSNWHESLHHYITSCQNKGSNSMYSWLTKYGHCEGLQILSFRHLHRNIPGMYSVSDLWMGIIRTFAASFTTKMTDWSYLVYY